MANNARERTSWSVAVGDAVRAERARNRLSQSQVSALSGVSRSTYLRIESGKHVADVSELIRICGVYDLPVSEFMERVEANYDPETPGPEEAGDAARGA